MPSSIRKFVVGLTGGIGTGKSEALRAFSGLGAETVSLDAIAHELSRKGKPLHRSIVAALGREYLDRTGELNRRAIRDAVFRSPGLRRRLERATHPHILRRMRREVAASRRPVVVVDVPLLFEAGVAAQFDATLVVSASKAKALSRVMKRDRINPATARRIMAAQWPIGRKEALADVVIQNDARLGDLKKRIKEYYGAFELIAHGARRDTGRDNAASTASKEYNLSRGNAPGTVRAEHDLTHGASRKQ